MATVADVHSAIYYHFYHMREEEEKGGENIEQKKTNRVVKSVCICVELNQSDGHK